LWDIIDNRKDEDLVVFYGPDKVLSNSQSILNKIVYHDRIRSLTDRYRFLHSPRKDCKRMDTDDLVLALYTKDTKGKQPFTVIVGD